MAKSSLLIMVIRYIFIITVVQVTDNNTQVRVIVPGVTGARNVKWLNRIVLSETECQGHWQQKVCELMNM